MGNGKSLAAERIVLPGRGCVCIASGHPAGQAWVIAVTPAHPRCKCCWRRQYSGRCVSYSEVLLYFTAPEAIN